MEAQNYVYRMDHFGEYGNGFFPYKEYGLCTLRNCKHIGRNSTPLENLDSIDIGSYVIGIGGNHTGKPGKIVYVMEVQEKLTPSEFNNKYPSLIPQQHDSCVLVSRKFFYSTEENEGDLSSDLKYLIPKKQGGTYIHPDNVDKIKAHLGLDW